MIRHTWFVLSCCAFVAFLGTQTFAAKRSNNRGDPPPEQVGLFEAIQAKTVEVTVIPRDSKRVTIQFANKTDKPIQLRMPAALVAAPVLAQFGPPRRQFGNGGNNLFGNGGNNLFGNGGNNGGMQQNQALGMAGGRQNMGNNGFNQQRPGGFFNIPPGRVIKKRIPTVCLEFGKPDPGPRIAYELRPLETFSNDERLKSLLVSFGNQTSDHQRAYQLAAWHIANGKSFEELASMSIKHVTGTVSRRFTSSEIDLAKKIVSRLPTPTKSQNPAKDVSLSQK